MYKLIPRLTATDNWNFKQKGSTCNLCKYSHFFSWSINKAKRKKTMWCFCLVVTQIFKFLNVIRLSSIFILSYFGETSFKWWVSWVAENLKNLQFCSQCKINICFHLSIISAKRLSCWSLWITKEKKKEKFATAT